MTTKKAIPQARKYLSRLHLFLNRKRFIHATLNYLRNTCGNPNCKCARGEKHLSLYIRRTSKGKMKKVLVPRRKWDEVKEMVQNYKEMQSLIDVVSDNEWEHIKDK
jgi:hypothetical protein